MESYLEKAVLGVVALAAAGADHVTTPSSPSAIIVLGDGESRSTTARDEEHAQVRIFLNFRGKRDSTTVARLRRWPLFSLARISFTL